jgi:hypothetical protein
VLSLQPFTFALLAGFAAYLGDVVHQIVHQYVHQLTTRERQKASRAAHEATASRRYEEPESISETDLPLSE